MSSWCLADVDDPPGDWEQGMSDLPTPTPPVVIHAGNESRRDSLASWDGDALLFERGQSADDASWTRVRGEEFGRRASFDSLTSAEGETSMRRESLGSVADYITTNDSDDSEDGSHMRRKNSVSSTSSSSRADKILRQDVRRGSVESVQSFSSEQSAWSSPHRGEGVVATEWPCPRCSFLNHILLPTCEMCDSPPEGPQDLFVQSAPRLRPSFADVVRTPPRAISVMNRRNVRARGGGQKPVLRVPRVRANAGLALMAKCNRTLSSASLCPSGPIGHVATGKPYHSPRAFGSSGGRSDRKGSDKYYLPAIEGIPEEEEEDAKDYEMQDLNLRQLTQESDSGEEDEMLHTCTRALAISVDVEEIPLSEVFPEEHHEIYLPISP